MLLMALGFDSEDVGPEEEEVEETRLIMMGD
jgi:hypothetical protein